MDQPNESRVIHEHKDQQYQVTFKRESTKGIDGFTVTANGDDRNKAFTDAWELYKMAKDITKPESTGNGTDKTV